MSLSKKLHLLTHKIALGAIFVIFSIGLLFTSFTRAEGIVFRVNVVADAQCFNGIDDDGDGLLDYPADTDCVDQDDESELNSSPDSPSSGGGGSSSPSTTTTTDIPLEEPPIINPENTISLGTPTDIVSQDRDTDLNSAPEEDTKLTQISPPKKITPRVKIKIPVRLTLREEGKVVFTNEPIPLPPRTDSLPLFDMISELDGAQLQVTNG